MQTQYKVLSKRVDAALEVLNDLQQRDDNMYRVILQAEPVNDEIRNNGIYNPSRYENLLQMSDAELVVSTSQKVDNLARQVYVQCNSMNELVKLAQGQEERIKHIPAIQPVSNKDLKRTASGYGYRIDPIYKTTKFHQGMDFSANVGTPVYVTGNGRVVETGWQQGFGNTVVIDHGYDYKTRYAHLSKILVRKGQEVIRGEENSRSRQYGEIHRAAFTLRSSIQRESTESYQLLFLRPFTRRLRPHDSTCRKSRACNGLTTNRMKEPVTNKQKLYYTIGEVSDMFNVNQSLLRYWETEFKTINPKRSPKGTRYYSQKDIEEIKLIHYLLKERKLKIEGAKQVLKHKRESTVRSQQVVERLKSLRSELIAIMEELE